MLRPSVFRPDGSLDRRDGHGYGAQCPSRAQRGDGFSPGRREHRRTGTDGRRSDSTGECPIYRTGFGAVRACVGCKWDLILWWFGVGSDSGRKPRRLPERGGCLKGGTSREGTMTFRRIILWKEAFTKSVYAIIRRDVQTCSRFLQYKSHPERQFL